MKRIDLAQLLFHVSRVSWKSVKILHYPNTNWKNVTANKNKQTTNKTINKDNETKQTKHALWSWNGCNFCFKLLLAINEDKNNSETYFYTYMSSWYGIVWREPLS